MLAPDKISLVAKQSEAFSTVFGYAYAWPALPDGPRLNKPFTVAQFAKAEP